MSIAARQAMAHNQALVATEAVCADWRPISRHWNCLVAKIPDKLRP